MKPGTRVRLTCTLLPLLIISQYGEIVGPDERYDGYMVIELDVPAYYIDDTGTIIEAVTNVVAMTDDIIEVLPT